MKLLFVCFVAALSGAMAYPNGFFNTLYNASAIAPRAILNRMDSAGEKSVLHTPIVATQGAVDFGGNVANNVDKLVEKIPVVGNVVEKSTQPFNNAVDLGTKVLGRMTGATKKEKGFMGSVHRMGEYFSEAKQGYSVLSNFLWIQWSFHDFLTVFFLKINYYKNLWPFQCYSQEIHLFVLTRFIIL